MGNFGIRISAPGNDVKTCSDLNTVVNSKYANLKGHLSGSGSVSVPSGDTVTVTIPHGLGYPVIIRAFINTEGPPSNMYQEIPIFDTGSVFTTWEFDTYSDSTNAYITFFWYDDLAGSTIDFYYKYLIFIDKGKL